MNLTFNQSFICLFHISKTKLFKVSYLQFKGNTHKYYITGISSYTPIKGFHSKCQTQYKYLSNEAKTFYDKWYSFQTKDLTIQQYLQLVNDLEKLTKHYNTYVILSDEIPKSFKKGYNFYPIQKDLFKLTYLSKEI
jgi:5'(3')-deoxyribonucleotidase